MKKLDSVVDVNMIYMIDQIIFIEVFFIDGSLFFMKFLRINI